MMPIDSSVLILLVLFPIIIAIIYFGTKRLRKLDLEYKRILEGQALKHNGTIVNGGNFSYPCLNIQADGYEILVYSVHGGKSSPPSTFVKTEADFLKDTEIKIYCEYHIPVLKALAGQEIETNNPEFDKAFFIKGNHEAIVRKLLTLENQKKLLDLKKYSPLLEVKKGAFFLSIRCIPETDEKFGHLIDTGIALLKRLKD